eukprot:1395034-Amphidinium_carterae.1
MFAKSASRDLPLMLHVYSTAMLRDGCILVVKQRRFRNILPGCVRQSNSQARSPQDRCFTIGMIGMDTWDAHIRMSSAQGCMPLRRLVCKAHPSS